MDDQAHVAANLRLQGALSWCPITAAVLGAAADDAEAGGPTWSTVAPMLHLREDDALGLRLVGAAHRAALRGGAPGYARHLPTCGGDGDVIAAARAFLDLVATGDLDGELVPVQTNEVGRLNALRPAIDAVRSEVGPVRLLEVGASAGLLLRGMGPAADRRGCDPNPLDPASPGDRLLLLSFVWPSEVDRFRRLDAALNAAVDDPVTIDRAAAAGWLRQRLAEPRPGVTTVVFHSLVWQYIAEEERDEVRRLLLDAGVAWLRFEPDPDYTVAETRLTLDGEEHLLATSGFHGQDVTWLGLPA